MMKLNFVFQAFAIIQMTNGQCSVKQCSASSGNTICAGPERECAKIREFSSQCELDKYNCQNPYLRKFIDCVLI